MLLTKSFKAFWRTWKARTPSCLILATSMHGGSSASTSDVRHHYAHSQGWTTWGNGKSSKHASSRSSPIGARYLSGIGLHGSLSQIIAPGQAFGSRCSFLRARKIGAMLTMTLGGSIRCVGLHGQTHLLATWRYSVL